MGRLPVVSGRQARRAFEKAGWEFDRQRGSHMILVRSGCSGLLSVPNHRELDTGLLRGLIRDSGLTAEEFLALLLVRLQWIRWLRHLEQTYRPIVPTRSKPGSRLTPRSRAIS